MKAQNLALSASSQPRADVALPQLLAFSEIACLFRSLSARVHVGRTQAVFTSHKGAAQSTPPANKWSRGCRALSLPYWHCAWSLSWPHAPKKPKTWFTWTNRLSLKSLFSPANTSNTKGRVLLGLTAWPALFLFKRVACAARFALSAKIVLASRMGFAALAGLAYGASVNNDATWSTSCVPQPSSPSSPLPLSRPAPRKKSSSPSRWLTFRLSRPIPALINNTAGRGYGPAFASAISANPNFASKSFAPCNAEVASC
ncbi:MAG: hypothetical protein JWS11_2624 [Cypionkella sp.]|nr:hypothetical protein [Cypionkella sp.]